MGRRVQFALSDLIGNFDLEVLLTNEVIEDEDDGDEVVNPVAKVTDKRDNGVYGFDVETLNDVVTLACDFNEWGAAPRIRAFLDNHGICYRVV